MKLKKITSWFLVLSLAFVNFYCKEPKETQKETITLLVTFVTGNVKIIQKSEAGAKELDAKVGMKVKMGDAIKTENGKIDLQTKTGSTIRIREMTVLNIDQLASLEGGETKIQLEHGNVLANVQKSTSKEEFKVATPTAIAGVRGTVFSVEFDPFEKKSKVEVMEGKVSMQPRIALLEKVSKEEIEAKPELKKLAEIQSKEVIIEENKQGFLNPQVEKQIVSINEQSEEVSEPEKIEIKSEDMQKLDKIENKIEVKNFTPTPELILEKETMISLNQEELNQVEETQNIGQILEKKHQEVKIKEEQILKKIEEQASKKQLKTETEIKQQYNKLEVITLRDGRKITGAVIAQTDDVMVIHTPKGIIREKKENIQSQEFK